MNATTELVVETCWCGMPHAVPVALVNEQRRQHDDGDTVTGIYCPLGHVWVPSGEPKIKAARVRIAELEASLLATRDQLDTANTEMAKHRKRTANGVCPCCKRSFVQLARHMKSQHPDYAS